MAGALPRRPIPPPPDEKGSRFEVESVGRNEEGRRVFGGREGVGGGASSLAW